MSGSLELPTCRHNQSFIMFPHRLPGAFLRREIAYEIIIGIRDTPLSAVFSRADELVMPETVDGLTE